MALLSAYQDRMSNLQKGVLFGLVAVGTSAVVNSYLSSKAENDNPPIGKFVEVDGVRLHYVEIGKGDPVVFLHGNGSMIQDFASSGLLDLAAKSHRVIAFDRPGFGRSELTDDRAWTPAAQAKLLRAAFNRLSIEKPTVVGHSWGTLVALRLAVDFRNDISRLVLLSGYYFPTVRADTWLSTPGSLPLLGPIIQHTIGPIIARISSKSAFEQMFDPLPVSPQFVATYPTELAVRPSQLQAVASETAMMPAAVETIMEHYKFVQVPTQLFAGGSDHVVNTEKQTAQLHSVLPNSTLHVEEGVGHMVHHAIPQKIAAALAS